MKIIHPRTQKNFGDDLNRWLWKELLPDVFCNTDDHELFYGIGTILHQKMPETPKKIIFGSGCGYKKPPTINESFKIYFVRGPLTAKKLRIDDSLAISDPAYLILDTEFARKNIEKKYKASFIPHHLSIDMLNWSDILGEANINFINPADHYLDVITKIRQSDFVITESLHGAILADAFRVNWLPVRFSYRFLDFKWKDWCQSVNVDFRPIDLPPVFQGVLNTQKQFSNFWKCKLKNLGLGPRKWAKRPYKKSTAAEIDTFISFVSSLAHGGQSFLSDDRTHAQVIALMRNKLEQFQKD